MNQHLKALLGNGTSLHPEHLADLKKSGISDDTITAQKIRTVPLDMISKLLGFPTPTIAHAYLLPFADPRGDWCDHIRLKAFPSPGTNKHAKYLQPKGSGVRLFFPVATLHAALHGNEPLWLVEGEKKALAVAQLRLPAVGFCGIENWHLGGTTELLPDFACISLRQRQLYLVPDGDAATNSAVRRGAERFAAALARCGAKPELVVLPTELPGMSKVGVDDYIVRTNATAEDLERLPRRTIVPLIHLVDLERTENVGHVVQTDIVIAGVGETFHVPQAWAVDCGHEKCHPSPVDIGSNSKLLEFCRTSASQLTGAMRGLSGCTHRSAVKITKRATVTEILAVPAATMDAGNRDYREKTVHILGTLPNSNVRYRATGEVIAEPRSQRASLLVTALDRLQSASESFQLTPDVVNALQAFKPPTDSPDDGARHIERIAATATKSITKVYGEHREMVLLAILLAFHSLREIPWNGEIIKGTLDLLVIGDTGQGKTTQYRRLSHTLGLGYFASGSTSSRTGILYSQDGKINDRRILRWGAFPLAHGELLAIDEAQNISREQWAELTTARSEGVLKVDRAIRAEHPSRTRLICFANPKGQTSMAGYEYGIKAVHPAEGIFTPQDLRRFDLVACVTENDQTPDDIKDGVDPVEVLEITAAALRASVLWAWTRTAEHVQYAADTEPAILALSEALQGSSPKAAG